MKEKPWSIIVISASCWNLLLSPSLKFVWLRMSVQWKWGVFFQVWLMLQPDILCLHISKLTFTLLPSQCPGHFHFLWPLRGSLHLCFTSGDRPWQGVGNNCTREDCLLKQCLLCPRANPCLGVGRWAIRLNPTTKKVCVMSHTTMSHLFHLFCDPIVLERADVRFIARIQRWPTLTDAARARCIRDWGLGINVRHTFILSAGFAVSEDDGFCL